MNLADLPQRSDEWFRARLGKVTASRVADLMAKTKTGYAASRDNYKAELVVQRLTQALESSYSNAAMQWGVDHEPLARAAYESKRGILVKEVGFIDHPTIQWAGASPDGLVEDGLIEIKCPQAATHLEYLQAKKPPRKYLLQMQFQMACSGRQWCDFVSYHPKYPPHLQLLEVRIERDSALIEQIEEEVSKFLGEVEAAVSALKEAA